MISAVIIVLREVLEIVPLICMLMASAAAMELRLRWLPLALGLGVIGALTYGSFLEQISMAFDGLGQEVINASLLLAVALLLIAYNFFAARQVLIRERSAPGLTMLVICVAAVAMSMSREGAEIYLYVYAFGVQAGEMVSVGSGAAIGAGIGLSLGTFLYYGLRALSKVRCLWISIGIATVTGAGMVMQATYYLAQADLIPGQSALWDSNALVPEESLMGELLRATLGYEATPTAVQLGLYVASIIASLSVLLLARMRLKSMELSA